MCTSFAVYYQEPIYGMNIDHWDRERKFKLTSLKCDKSCIDSGNCDSCVLKNHMVTRFHCQNRENNRFMDSACMNSFGFFSNYQFLVPNHDTDILKPKLSVSDGNLFSQSQMYTRSTTDLISRMGNKTVYYKSFGQYKLHNMFADQEGSAFILESSENGNEISHVEDRFIVMTNFPVYEFRGKPYKEVFGEGSDRYLIAYEEIIKNKSYFSVKEAFTVLKKAQLTYEFSPTVCSMVFDPLKLQVYISLFGIFDKIWRVSMLDKTIETYEGFSERKQLKIGSKGILASQLEEYM